MHVPLSISFCFSLHLLNANWIPNGFVCWIILWATSNKHFWIKFNADFSFSFARHSAYLSFSLRTLIICHRPLHFTLGNNQNYTGMNIHLVFLLLDKLVRKKFKCFSHGRVCTWNCRFEYIKTFYSLCFVLYTLAHTHSNNKYTKWQNTKNVSEINKSICVVRLCYNGCMKM